MAELLFLPKDTKDPKNHPRRLYFSCHPEDFPLLEQIYGDIRKIYEDFVIFYPDLSAGDVVYDHLDEIANTQLFVIPVTKKLLTEENGALSLEFERAVQEKLGILPILFEPEAEALFNSMCDRRQMVAKWDSDYEEKLHRALDDALVSDEITQRVRDIFQNHLFVSYCREDKPHAEQVIRLIHQNKDMRMISVWYDKYLTLGKDFEQTLKEKLEHCQLFALTVTPNLISRETYVKSTEYPAARGKPIFPVEMLATDQQKLIDYFTNEADREKDTALLQLIGADSPKALSQKLAAKIRDALPHKLPCRTADTNYLLGMAYLNGIEVEYDRDFARDILIEAANAGSFDAYAQLVTMYRRGIGTVRNPDEAIRWQKKAVEKRRTAFQKAIAQFDNQSKRRNSSPEAMLELQSQLWQTGKQYCFELLSLVSLSAEESRYDLADQCYAWLDKAKAAVDKRLPDADFLQSSSIAWRAKRGQLDTLQQKKNGHSAKESYEQAKAAYEKDPENYHTAVLFCGCSQIYAYELMSDQIATTVPAQILSDSLKVLQKLYKQKPNDTELLDILTLTLRDMGSFLRKLAAAYQKAHIDFDVDLPIALQLYQHCLAVWQQRADLKPENHYWPLLRADILSYIAHTHLLMGKKEAAIASYLSTMHYHLELEQEARGKNYGSDYLSNLYQSTPRIMDGLLKAGFTDKAWMRQTLADIIGILDRDPLSGTPQRQAFRSKLTDTLKQIP